MLNDSTFALPYWDWTDENRRDEIWNLIGKSDCGVFSDTPNSDTIEAPVDGPFSNWNTICTNLQDIVCNASNQIRNPTKNPDSVLVVFKEFNVGLISK